MGGGSENGLRVPEGQVRERRAREAEERKEGGRKKNEMEESRKGKRRDRRSEIVMEEKTKG